MAWRKMLLICEPAPPHSAHTSTKYSFDFDLCYLLLRKLKRNKDTVMRVGGNRKGEVHGRSRQGPRMGV